MRSTMINSVLIVLSTMIVAFGFSMVPKPFQFKILSSSIFSYQSSSLSTSFSFSMKQGGHGDGFKYLPILTTAFDEHFPRILPIAGVYPTATPEEVLAPKSTPSAPKGMWAYEFTDSDGPQLGTVALPGSDIMTDAIDPVVLIARNSDLNIQVNDDVETLLVVDRGVKEIQPDKFYLLQTPNHDIIVLWMDEIPDGFEVLGQVILCAIPSTEAMRPKPTGFAEEDEG